MYPDPLRTFLLRVVLWLPVCFAAWYLSRALLNLPVLWGLRGLAALLPLPVQQVEYHGALLAAVLAVPQDSLTALAPVAGRTAELLVELNPLAYGYGLPLFTGLLLASPGDQTRKWRQWLMALVVLWAVQLWGLEFELLKTWLFDLPPPLQTGPKVGPWQREAVALGYQLGYLILPGVTPLVLWLGLQRRFVARLADR